MITGAASGIGRALARRLSQAGSPVAIADLDEAGLKETAESLPGPVLTRVLDVGDAGALLTFAAEVRDWRPAPLGSVFNNAGVTVATTVAGGDPADDEWLRRINFDGVVNGTRAFLPILLEQDEGVIVNTSSVFGLVGMPYQSAYCASKFAVRGFTDALRQELRGTGVSAVNVHPGGIATNIARNARVRREPGDGGLTHDQLVAEFDAMVRTTPEKAAGSCRGAGRCGQDPGRAGRLCLTRWPGSHRRTTTRSQALDRCRARRAAAMDRPRARPVPGGAARRERPVSGGPPVSEHADVVIVGAGCLAWAWPTTRRRRSARPT
jgi:NADP-dependent 3-hydroxy acid dehydrogenase YdfG